ncbi:four-carbon acid sugar kinase family protein [Dactylosporangium sp. CA-092794]|uniref:four-carbon acid sugar kinase family protein n=1 Tax=Dactylosporangium sp. CA-092794 TaxID=3239929 RepID=UPI003D910AD9
MRVEAAPEAPPWGAVPPVRDVGRGRALIRAARARMPRATVVLDDDPTGSQSVHDLQVVTSLEAPEYRSAMDDPAGGCFVLTNTRSLPRPEAVALTAGVADDLFAIAGDRGTPLELVSRSDSTLRGHVIAEVDALDAAHRRALGTGYDAVLLAPAFLEAGRVTAGDVHWARVGGQFLPAGETEFARDKSFGYTASNLREFVAELSGGRIAAAGVGSIGLADIREGGPEAVARVLQDSGGGRFVVVNALDYADLEIVVLGALAAQERGMRLLYRTGPSFVRALLGQQPRPPLTTEQIWPEGRPAGHGLVVVGSHVGQTGRQLAELARRGGAAEVELDVTDLLARAAGGADDLVRRTGDRVADLLSGSDVVLYTSRRLVAGDSAAASLEISRRVSAAVSAVVRGALPARPAWVLAKGGITSHDVAVHGLSIRRAEVAGQFFPGVVSLFRPVAAHPAILGRPYVVFAGNVGDDTALADVVTRLRGEG